MKSDTACEMCKLCGFLKKHKKKHFCVQFNLGMCGSVEFIYTYIYTHTHTHTYIYIYICVCVCVYIYIYVCMYVYIHTVYVVFCKFLGVVKKYI